MSFVGKAIGSVVGGITGAKAAGKAAEAAGETQAASAQAGIDEQRRQFDTLVELMSPYLTAGETALGGLAPFAAAGAPALQQQQALIGLQGPEAERAAIERISSGETYKALAAQGENAMLQQASATGGLRGGNIQGALSQFRPQLLTQLIEQQYGRLGGMTSLGAATTGNIVTMGQASAANQAASGMQSADSIANLLANQGAATAGGQIARGNVNRQAFGDLMNIAKAGAGFF